MNKHENINELLVDLILGELSPEQESEVKTHLTECRRCDCELKRFKTLLDYTNRIQKLSVDTRMCESAKQAIFETVERQEMTQPTLRPNISLEFIWSTIMKRPITRLAAAVVVIVAILISMHQFGGSSVVWGQVIKKLEKINTYSFRKRHLETTEPQKESFETEIETKVYYSLEYGEWSESYRNGQIYTRTYALQKEKEFIGIVPLARIYDRRPLSEASIREMDQNRPRQVVKRFLEADYKKLGSDIIDGVAVEGVEIHDPKVLNPSAPVVEDFTARLWVDVETELPVRLELQFVTDGKLYTKMIFDQFQWNIQLDASDFEPNIPADYTLGTDSTG